jgi:hypothetical protein
MAYHEPVSRQKILIVGGGFGGIKAALELGKGDNSKFDITFGVRPSEFSVLSGAIPNRDRRCGGGIQHTAHEYFE